MSLSLSLCLCSGQPVDLDEYDDVHLAAVLLKSFFRELQEPVFPFFLYENVLRVSGNKIRALSLSPSMSLSLYVFGCVCLYVLVMLLLFLVPLLFTVRVAYTAFVLLLLNYAHTMQRSPTRMRKLLWCATFWPI